MNKSAPVNNDRRFFHAVDSVRGIAAVGVCWFHIGLWSNLLPDGVLKYSASFWWLGPHLFFIASGFVVPWSMHGAGYQWCNAHRYIARRMVRLDPPYIVTILMVVLLSYVGALIGVSERAFELNAVQLLSHLAYLTEIIGDRWYNPVFWTLAIEFQFYLTLAIIFPLVASNNDLLRRVVMLSLLLAFAPFAGAVQTTWMLGYLPLFMLGFVLFQYHAGIIDNREMCLWSAALIVIAGTYTMVLIPLSLLAFLVMFEDSFRNRVTEFLGKISYSLYLIHMPIGIPFVKIAQRYARNDIDLIIIAFAAVALCIAFAWVFYWLVEKPSIRLAKRIAVRGHIADSYSSSIKAVSPAKAIAD